MLKNNPDLFALKQSLVTENRRITGLVKGTSKAFGFLDVEGRDSIFIRPEDMKKLRHGDIVEGVEEVNGDKTYFLPEKLLEQAEPLFVGRVRRVTGTMCMIEPDHPLDNVWHFLPPSQASDLEVDDWVKVQMIKHPFDGRSRLKLVKLIAKKDDDRAPWEYAIALHNVPSDYLSKPGNAKFDLTTAGGVRRDLRNLPFFTIDSASTRDMDDALHIVKQENGNLVLTVAIADPTEIIKPDSLDDLVAKQRGFTVYLPARTIPMLPPQYSDNVFSLKQDQDNLSLCATITYDSSGNVLEYDFFEAYIKSKAKLVYSEVSDWLENAAESTWKPSNDAITSQLELMKEYYEVRSAWRRTHATVFPDTPDYDFMIEDWKVAGVLVHQRRIANKIVEEAMISANNVCADFLKKNSDKGVFNVHAGFDPNYIDMVAEVTQSIDVKFTAEYVQTLAGYCELRRQLDSGNYDYEDLMLRGLQAKTEFCSAPGQHMGLGFEAYATWTSPIRKYGDMLNHRIIKSILRNEPVNTDAITDELLGDLGESLGRQRRAERTVKDWLHRQYLKTRIGERLGGTVVYINKGGFNMVLDETGHSVFISKRFLGTRQSPAEIDIEKGIIKSTKGEVRLGQPFSIIIKSVDLDKREVNFEL